MQQTTLGFIGLGSMGGPMAARLARAGHRVAIFDLDRTRLDAAVASGALACPDAGAVGDAGDIVFCCLPSPAVSEQVAAELGQSRSCRVLVEMSTVGRTALGRIAAAAGPRI